MKDYLELIEQFLQARSYEKVATISTKPRSKSQDKPVAKPYQRDASLAEFKINQLV